MPKSARLITLDRAFQALAWASLLLSLLVLATLLLDIALDGVPRLTYDFLSGYPSRFAAKAGILPALVGSCLIILLTASISIPVGVGAAVYLEEYAPRNRLTRILELTLMNLAGVPSIIFGLLGLQVFVRWFGMGRSLLAGALTMSLLVLPVVVMAGREALRAVPKGVRDASLALGATKSETIRHQVLPAAFPGILTGAILAMSRVIGETTPLITIGALTYIPFLPDSVFSEFTVLPIQAFNWISRPQSAFHDNAAAAMVLLLAVLLLANSSAIYLRARLHRRSEI